MKTLIIKSSLLFVALIIPVLAQAQDRVWVSTGVNTNWSPTGNWGGNTPDSNSETAVFRNDEGWKSVNNNNDVTIQGIRFVDNGSMTSGYTIIGASNTLTIDVNSTNNLLSSESSPPCRGRFFRVNHGLFFDNVLGVSAGPVPWE